MSSADANQNNQGIFDSVQFDKIIPSHDFQEKIFQFFNPRLFHNVDVSANYSEAEIETLKESIKNKGLQDILVVNKVDGIYYLLEGHRRREAINILRSKNDLCYDEKQKAWVSARELYDKVPVKVYENLSATEAFAKVFCIDNHRINFSENVVYRFIDFCLQSGLRKETIAKMCDKSVAQVSKIISLLTMASTDEFIKNKFLQGNIDSDALETLMTEFTTPEDRKEAYDKAMEHAQERTKSKLSKMDSLILSLHTKVNKAKQQKAQAVAVGDFSRASEIDTEISEHLAGLEERKSTRNRESTAPAKISKIDTSKAKDEITGSPAETVIPEKPQKFNSSHFNDWKRQVQKVIDKGNLTNKSEEIPSILNLFVDDLLKTIADTSGCINYDEFISLWASKFTENGLQMKMIINEDDDQTKSDEKVIGQKKYSDDEDDDFYESDYQTDDDKDYYEEESDDNDSMSDV